MIDDFLKIPTQRMQNKTLMDKTLKQGMLDRAAVLALCFLSVIGLFILGAIINSSDGEQNISAYVLIFLFYTSPVWIIAIFLVAFVAEFLSRKRK